MPYKDRERRNANSRAYYSKPENVKKRSDYMRSWHAKNKASRKYTLKTAYGITLEDYQRMHEEQNGVCKICSGPPTTLRRKGNIISTLLYVDHNHSTGKVRGLLCQKCNMVLGLLKEDIALFAKSIEYLQTEGQLDTTG